MFTATAFNQLPMGFRYPAQQQPPSLYQSQYGGFNPQIPISFQQVSLSRGQSLPPVVKQCVQSKGSSYASKPSRRTGQHPPVTSNQQSERKRKHGLKNKRSSKQNVSSNGIADQGLYSDKEKNNPKNSEDRSRSPSALLEHTLQQDESANDNNNQKQLTQSVQNTNNGNASQGGANGKDEEDFDDADDDEEQQQQQQQQQQGNSEGNKKRKSRSKKKKHDRTEHYERDNTHFEQAIPPFYADLPTHLRVHQQPLYSSYNQVYEESIRRGDVFHKQVKRSTRLPPEAKQKLLPHEDDQTKAYPVVGYVQSPFNPYPSYTARPNFYGAPTPLNMRQPWPNQGVPQVVDGPKVDRLRNHIHSLENELHKLQKKLNKATLNTNHNNETPTKKDESVRTHRRSKCDNVGSPRQTPVIVELNSTINENGRGELSSKKQSHRIENNTNAQPKINQLTDVSEPNTTSSNNQKLSQSPNRQQMNSKERTHSQANHVSETEVKVSTPMKSSREETAARLAHAAAARVQARQQIPPPPPVQQNFVPTQEKHQQRLRLSMNDDTSQSNDTFQPQRKFPILNNNQSNNNNETLDITEKKTNRSVEKILDAFERFYIKDGKSAVPAIKVKYIPEDTNSNSQRRPNVNNNNQPRSSGRSKNSSSSSSASSSSSSSWSNANNSSSGNFNGKKCNCLV